MKEIFSLKDKRAVITGGGSGIGKAIALRLAYSEAEVFVLDFNEEMGNQTVEEIHKEGQKAHFYKCDVSNTTAVQQVFDEIGCDLDILINNAGIAHIGNLEGTGEEDFDRIYNVNVKGVFNCLKAGVGYMRNGGSVINMSSIAAHVGISDRFAYSMSKGAVHAMTLSFARDYLASNIRCNSISPGRVHTPFVDGFLANNYPGKEEEMFEKLSKSQPIGRMGKPEEIGALVLYLCSNEASFITGSDFPIDGGFITLNN